MYNVYGFKDNMKNYNIDNQKRRCPKCKGFLRIKDNLITNKDILICVNYECVDFEKEICDMDLRKKIE